ncbi:MAG: hypothetical protein A3G32_02965 [Deltaproteobacteria bacterium RIFCSPLOWO2_12_FULL_40_28]|nr:MAG: hypothetical protein A3C45_01650 [Deltaproteobacteria bacterium RIFCSPHIGHO2_02_FULL_40_28]OGQ19524.1 MAG: hypothetical protein A3E27_02210 [Deltaproteobacteria bacterium RIFCSPHIGHO2_12_FULL_40_32]OGQ39998.1 MAG: hypothetical protein A3I69_08175 [Deltaproteobacteria bacterium RIFCSPLOWO2_02_FULL_40_36]OGQ54329.1 MAG: hypothetical protein A3G32_02965 [Deltaproteobacteria bacterium RIFCSPLOWO2_12_FULL_40_28]
MKKNLKNSKGFTMVELVLVIAVLGILAISAMPNMFSVSLTTARSNSMDAVVGAVQAGLSLYASEQVASTGTESYPSLLETTDLADGTPATRTNRMFDNILQNGVSNQWFKLDDDCYAYDTDGDGSFDDGSDSEFQYTSGTTGSFVLSSDCGS